VVRDVEYGLGIGCSLVEYLKSILVGEAVGHQDCAICREAILSVRENSFEYDLIIGT
jgi:hypothetical protein